MPSKRKGNILNAVPKLEEKRKESDYLTVKESLEEALAGVNGKTTEDDIFRTANKILIIALDDSDGGYRTGFIQGGLKMSQCVGLVEVIKMRFLYYMGRL